MLFESCYKLKITNMATPRNFDLASVICIMAATYLIRFDGDILLNHCSEICKTVNITLRFVQLVSLNIHCFALNLRFCVSTKCF